MNIANLLEQAEACVEKIRATVSDAGEEGASLVSDLASLSDETVMEMTRLGAELSSLGDAVTTIAAGEASRRSDRTLGYAGLAQRQGHGSAARLVQHLTGASRADAYRHVRVGAALGEAEAAARSGGGPLGDPLGETAGGSDSLVDGDSREAGASPWHSPLTLAVAAGRVGSGAVNAIMRGLRGPDERIGEDALRVAAEELLIVAGEHDVDELLRLARRKRDEIDPDGVVLRERERFERRSLRAGRSSEGLRTAYLVFDDLSADRFFGALDARLAPRRGGPRFVDATGRAAAKALVDDARSNEQLAFDFFMDMVTIAGQADPQKIYGARQPGVRVVITREQLDTRGPDGRVRGFGYSEETHEPVSGPTIEQLICDSGTREVVVDGSGSPLDVGRDQRLFTARQRVALSIRDGGCLMPGCDWPPSRCEAHHIDHWARDHGRTDVADGILLCKHHHMLVHNNGWEVRRDVARYWLVAPPDSGLRRPIELRSKAPWRAPARSRPTAAVARAVGVVEDGSVSVSIPAATGVLWKLPSRRVPRTRVTLILGKAPTAPLRSTG